MDSSRYAMEGLRVLRAIRSYQSHQESFLQALIVVLTADIRQIRTTVTTRSSKSPFTSETSPLCFRNLFSVTCDIISDDERWGVDHDKRGMVGGASEAMHVNDPTWNIGDSQLEAFAETSTKGGPVDPTKTSTQVDSAMETEHRVNQFCLSLLNETPLQDVAGKSNLKEANVRDARNKENQYTKLQWTVTVTFCLLSTTAAPDLTEQTVNQFCMSLLNEPLANDLTDNFDELLNACVDGVDLHGPNWSLGISQQFISQQETDVGSATPKVNDSEMELDQTTIDYCLQQLNENATNDGVGGVSKSEDPHTVGEAKWREVVDKFEANRKKPIRDKGIAEVNKSPYVIRGVDLNNDLTKEDEMDKFATNMNGVLAGVLKEMAFAKDKPDMNNLKIFDMVFFPILEFNHYYLLVFELKNCAISVIDNFHESIPLVGVKDSADYYLKDSPYKVKDIFVRYLERIKHAKTDEIHAARIQKVQIPWATKTNAVDCGVFLMRHMEKFMRIREQFNYGFSTNGKKKKCQLNMLRKKYLVHVIKSEVNSLRNVVVDIARDV
ncbi:hypothetical protein E3N88_27781 [Mikania micrantha]|uniref:Ubiquitin-like protease family profile domain-containing protein n=1 Tax=Mikania micrantha TaxID=192012 RepID=A0A5N6MYR1_9ASTR|nr:hypothetical protein E3N88_27781 [Mikania micrantha]